LFPRLYFSLDMVMLDFRPKGLPCFLLGKLTAF
jgi:hypothetical protein